MAVLRQQDGDSKNLQDILSVNSISCLLLLHKAVEGLLLAFTLYTQSVGTVKDEDEGKEKAFYSFVEEQ